MKELYVVNQEKPALVDDDDFEYLSQFRWYARTQDGVVYAIMTKPPTVGGKRPTLYMHRMVTDAPDDKFVDHINHDVFDNRKENLRLVNNQQNCFNRRSTNPLGYKGVFQRKEKRYSKPRYRSYINVDGKRINLGTYGTPEEAALAYNEKAKEIHGEFAYLNQIPEKKV